MKNKFASSLVCSLFFCLCTLPVQAETVLEEIQRTGILSLAIREDAAPFGYTDANGSLQGYCLDFFALLEKQLTRHLQRKSLSIKLLKSTTSNRFFLVSNNIVNLECGPNTITSNPPNKISFSQAFFTTGTQFLVRKKDRNLLNNNQNLREIRFGAIANTTTEEFIAETYPNSATQKFSGVTARNRGIQALSQGQIDAMASDGILLRAEAQQQGLLATEYPLIPEIPLTCDHYGMIIDGDDIQWKEFVNSVINSSETAALSQKWFGDFLSYRQATWNKCDSN